MDRTFQVMKRANAHAEDPQSESRKLSEWVQRGNSTV